MINCKDETPWLHSQALVVLIHAADYLKKVYTFPENEDMFDSYEHRQAWKTLDKSGDLLHAEMEFEALVEDLKAPGGGACQVFNHN